MLHHSAHISLVSLLAKILSLNNNQHLVFEVRKHGFMCFILMYLHTILTKVVLIFLCYRPQVRDHTGLMAQYMIFGLEDDGPSI